MRRFLTYDGVVGLLILLQTATVVVSLDKADFSDKFRKLVENILGIHPYEQHLRELQSDFAAVAPNGEIFTKLVAEDINREVGKRADAVRRIKNAVVDSLAEGERPSRPKCCEDNVDFTVDPRFPGEVSKELCYIGKKPVTPPAATGAGEGTFNVMKRNLQLIPSLKWQYFGNEHGTLYVYPGFPGCDLDTYDPRFRPWYGFTATYPKDMVIMVDKSHEMKRSFGDNTRMFFGIQATKAVIDSLNPNDNIAVMAFADDVEFPKDPCYRQGLALATTANKEQINDFAVLIQPSQSSGANFSKAFNEAFRLLGAAGNDSNSTVINNKRDKVILLLSAGKSSEELAVVLQTISAGRQLAGDVTIIAFGLDVDEHSENGQFLTKVSDGLFTSLNNPDEDKVRQQIGVYYSHIPKPNTDETVVFSVPYNDTGGLGMITSGCLPVFALGEFQGVTCIDVPMETLFSSIIDFRLEQLSYAFLVDSRGRVLLHPLLPQPETYKQHPIFLDMESVEISQETPAIKRSMISGVAGSMSTTHLKLFPRRGDSPLEGVGSLVKSATYFWHPISEMNASMAVVIVSDETNISLSWPTDFPPVLLTDEISVSDNQALETCNNFGRLAVKDTSGVKFSIQSVKNKYFYREQGIGSDTEAVKSYLQGETDSQGSLAVKDGVRESVAMTYELERIWKESAAANSNGSMDTLSRYVGTRDGVYRVYPAVRVPVKFDPTQQPQYRRSEVQRRRITLYTQSDPSGFATTSLTKAFTDPNGNVVLGVLGADVIFSPLYKYLRDNFDPCNNADDECFAIDRSGFVVIHKDFIDDPPKAEVHITAKEPEFAADLVQKGIMNNDSCVSYADITNQLFWKVEFRHDLKLTNGYIYAINDFDLFVIVKYGALSKDTGTCVCPAARSDIDKTECTPGSNCQCPCYSPTDYSYCSGHFTITDTTKTCYPATLPLYLPDFTSEERDFVQPLPICQLCSSFKSESECVMVGCCFTGSGCASCSTDTGCDSLCVGLVIGLCLAALLVVVVIVLVLVWRRRHRLPLPLPHLMRRPSTGDGSIPRGSLNTTVIQVQNSYEDDEGYSRPSSEPDYLHMEPAMTVKPLDAM